MLRKILVSFATLAWLSATPVRAADGSIVIIGNGEASALPEIVTLSVEVTSLCYDTSRGAKDANAVLANSLLTVLHNFATQQGDRVLAAGGANTRQTEVIDVGGASRTLCELKWRATNSLTIATSRLDGVPDLQDAVLAAVDATVVDPTHAAQTYAELGQPRFTLKDETLLSLRATAQSRAYDDAKAQFDTFAAHCLFQDARLTSITPPQYDIYARSNGDPIDASGLGTPIIPDDINVRARWRFEWTYTPSASCPR